MRFHAVSAECQCLLESIKYVFCIFIELEEAFFKAIVEEA
jgi:hypothetical protein